MTIAIRGFRTCDCNRNCFTRKDFPQAVLQVTRMFAFVSSVLNGLNRKKCPFARPSQEGWCHVQSSDPGKLYRNEISRLPGHQSEFPVGPADSANSICQWHG